MTASRPQATDRIANPTRILCLIDLSDFSQPALACAVALRRTFGADVTALRVFAEWLPPARLTTFPGWMIQAPEARESITNELARAAGAVCGEPIRTASSQERPAPRTGRRCLGVVSSLEGFRGILLGVRARG